MGNDEHDGLRAVHLELGIDEKNDCIDYSMVMCRKVLTGRTALALRTQEKSYARPLQQRRAFAAQTFDPMVHDSMSHP